jgi:hypothetical protein
VLVLHAYVLCRAGATVFQERGDEVARTRVLVVVVCRCLVSSPFVVLLSLLSAPFGLKRAEMECAEGVTTKSDACS